VSLLRAWCRARCDDADVPWPSPRAWRVAGLSFAAVEAAVAFAGGWVLAVVTAVAVAVAVVVTADAGRGRSGRRVDAALPGVLEAAARSLRSGASLRVALAEASITAHPRVRDGLAVAVRAAERGVPLVDAIDTWAASLPGEGARLAGAALALAAELGGAAARSLDAVAATLRERNAVRREVRALSSQARASALVIALAPAGFGLLAASVDPRTTQFLFRTGAGTVCLLVGVALDGAGAVWLHRLASAP